MVDAYATRSRVASSEGRPAFFQANRLGLARSKCCDESRRLRTKRSGFSLGIRPAALSLIREMTSDRPLFIRKRCEFPTWDDAGKRTKLCALGLSAGVSQWQMRVLMTVVKLALIGGSS
jgi:hypothetical protein